MDLHYFHQPLEDRNNDSIRLIRLRTQSDESGALLADLEEVRLVDKPNYIALSYTWDSPGVTFRLHIGSEGQHGFLDVRPNVNAVLRRLRSLAEAGQAIAIWIDAICINQEDLHEKSKQVSRMGDIYRNATQVVVYLGDSDDQTETGLRAINLLATAMDEPDMSDTEMYVDGGSDLEGVKQLLEDEFDHESDTGESEADIATSGSSREDLAQDAVDDDSDEHLGPQKSIAQVEMRSRALQRGIKRKRPIELGNDDPGHECWPNHLGKSRKGRLQTDPSIIQAKLRSMNVPEVVDALRRYVATSLHLRRLWRIGSGPEAEKADMIVDALESLIQEALTSDIEGEVISTTSSQLGLPFGTLLCTSIFEDSSRDSLDCNIAGVSYPALLRLAMLHVFSGESRTGLESERIQYLDLAADNSTIGRIRSNIEAPSTRSLIEITKEQLGDDLCEALALCSPDEDVNSTMRALFSFFDRPWFSRVWIQQEIVLAKNAQVWIGHHTVRWDTLFSADMFCFQNDLRFGRGVGTCAVLEGKRIMLDDDDSVPPASTFIAHAAYARRVKSTDPKDKLYGWLGLMRVEDSGRIQPDYTITPVETFRRFVELLITEYHSLEILALRFPGDGDDLPSWVPDLNGKSNVEEAGLGNLRTSYTNFSATGDSEVKARLSRTDPGRIFLAGIVFDEVMAVSVAFRQKETLGRTALLRKCTIELVITAWASLAKTFCPTLYPTGECLTQAFWKTLVQHRGSNGIRFTAEDRQAALQTVIYHLDTDLPIPDDISAHELQDDLMDEIYWRGSPETMLDYMAAQLGSLRFFVTRKGYMGLGYYNVEEGDRVALFSGGKMPFLITRACETTYRLRSVCYVHGLMDGHPWTFEHNDLSDICFI